MEFQEQLDNLPEQEGQIKKDVMIIEEISKQKQEAEIDVEMDYPQTSELLTK